MTSRCRRAGRNKPKTENCGQLRVRILPNQAFQHLDQSINNMYRGMPNLRAETHPKGDEYKRNDFKVKRN